ncbi:MAG: cobalamin-dependent protein [Parvibaculaceae bacterium]
MISRQTIFQGDRLPELESLIAAGRERARHVQAPAGTFLSHYNAESEAAYKREAMESGRIMQHAQIGFRDKQRSREAWAEIYESLQKRNVRVDRYGISFDWTMGLPRELRKSVPAGTGMLLDTPEDFLKLADMAPVAPHFGDFIMGFPSALENTEAALLAGSTSIGNLGQYFSFRLPDWDDDVATTTATVTALALIAAQEREVLVHSNLDDGYGAIFTDVSSILGLAIIERYIIEDLLGARISHCWGHHFTDPMRRMAFHLALSQVTSFPGTMVYGNTVGYRGNASENYASLASYLLTDVQGQRIKASGHAINPVPVTENVRIPDTDEIIEAQLFAARLIEHGGSYDGLISPEAPAALAEEIMAGGRRFHANVMRGLEEAGVDTRNAFEMLLAIKRIGGKRLEQHWGAGVSDETAPRGRRAVVEASFVEELATLARDRAERIEAGARSKVQKLKPKLMVATTDVHEHGKMALEQVFRTIGIQLMDGGVSVDADDLADAVQSDAPDAILVSSYNGIALDYFRALAKALADRNLKTPILIGGRLNQVPQGSNTSLPVDVTDDLIREGAIVCREIEDAVPALAAALSGRSR